VEFDRALQALCDAGVEFVVVGGVGAFLHGIDRLTIVLEICYARSAMNLKRLVKALAPFHPRPRGFPGGLPFIWDDATLRNGSLFTLETDLGDIDLLGEIAGLGAYDDVKAGSIEVEAHGRRFSTLDLRRLIKAKRAAGRPRDLDALPELESLLEAEEP
jgi:predicted nucleotidyltransferase